MTVRVTAWVPALGLAAIVCGAGTSCRGREERAPPLASQVTHAHARWTGEPERVVGGAPESAGTAVAGLAPRVASPGGRPDPRRVFDSFCARCHGVDGAPTKEGLALGAPDLRDAARQAAMSDEEMVKVIVEGRGKMPATNMPPIAARALVRVVRSLKK
jgi:mono/diheme cytochrome c family protein